MGRNPNTTIYFVNGDPFFQSIGGIFYKSTDGGTSWKSAIGLPITGSKVSDMKVDFSQSLDVIIIATNIGIINANFCGESFTLVSLYPTIVSFPQEITSIVKTSVGYMAFDMTNKVFMKSSDVGLTWYSRWCST